MTVTRRPARPESGDRLRDKLTPDCIFRSPEAASVQPPSQQSDVGDPDVSVVMPCLNEEESVAECVRQARGWIGQSGLTGEVVVVDNGSEDASAALAEAAGARAPTGGSFGSDVTDRRCKPGIQQCDRGHHR